MDLPTRCGVPLVWLALCALGCASDASTGDSSDDPMAGQDNPRQPQDEPGEPAAPAEPEFPAELLPEQVLDSLDLVAPLQGGRALFSGIVDIEPGDDATFCTFFEGVTEEPMYVHNTHGSQTQYGHHAIL
jgi:hypothetical protein